jgi:hypothetical protein
MVVFGIGSNEEDTEERRASRSASSRAPATRCSELDAGPEISLPKKFLLLGTQTLLLAADLEGDETKLLVRLASLDI